MIVDYQNDFCPGGALAVAGGDEIAESINALARDFGTVVATRDWHPPDHASFEGSDLEDFLRECGARGSSSPASRPTIASGRRSSTGSASAST